ncbi:MAG: hypothetical protein CL557_12675 [Alphaproteobacteria bacterium]|nr:hypothetical protein [Alphaproteobacteria bacterium]MBN59129.1 hypothetical protein [Oceanospirillaceae bacterium]MAJ64494.1 hypothetical protein [Alphaproteobacteria bacterium]MAJ64526.1 hypothetical protein [Alphaproteobacteria bacterium]MAS48248.1 hypothetical protein [Alphaproteobacteria bacterium]|tara:strand:+ start:1247 stop:1477 length:231 start_codon:yes stop_codon:yes gene_type:complete
MQPGGEASRPEERGEAVKAGRRGRGIARPARNVNEGRPGTPPADTLKGLGLDGVGARPPLFDEKQGSRLKGAAMEP